MEADIIARIDQPAFFDASVPSTSRFLAAMVAAQDITGNTTIDELQRLAARLEVTFEVAKAHAYTVGIDHLAQHQRDDARRASKVARLAASASNQGERRAAIAQLNRILAELGLYYLPQVGDRLEIERGPQPRR